MEQGAERITGPSACPTRAASPLIIVVGLVLLGHAALVLAGVFDAARWVPVLECVAVCAIGLVHLRRVEEPAPKHPPEAPPAPFPQPVVPGRVVAPVETGDRAAGA